MVQTVTLPLKSYKCPIKVNNPIQQNPCLSIFILLQTLHMTLHLSI